MKKNKQKKIIIFDVFGVLLTRGFASSASKLSHLLKRKISEIRPVYERWEVPFDLGALSEKRFWELVQQDLGTNIDWKVLNNIVLESYSIIEGSTDILDKCSKIVDTYLLSNTRKEWFEYLDKKFALSKRVKKSFLSYEMGLLKPSLECYLYVMHKIGCEPYQIIFIDDNQENIRAALSVGWNAHQFIDPKSAYKFISSHIELG